MLWESQVAAAGRVDLWRDLEGTHVCQTTSIRLQLKQHHTAAAPAAQLILRGKVGLRHFAEH
jgi:hypothetical protein